MPHKSVAFALLGFGFLGLGCSNSPTAEDVVSERQAEAGPARSLPSLATEATLPSLTISGPTLISVGGCSNFNANYSGWVSGPSLTWRSDNPSAATVSGGAFGRVCGVADGFSTIHADGFGCCANGGTISVRSNDVPVEVGQPIRSVRVTPSPVIAKAGTTVQLTAQAVDQFGFARTKAASWTSSNTSVASVTSTGFVTALTPGAATISATIKGYTGSASLTTGVSGVSLSGPGTISTSGTYQWTANVTPGGTYTYVWQVTTYGNNQHFSRSGNPLVLSVTASTGNISFYAKIYLNGVFLGSSPNKVVGNSIGGGGCGGKIC